MIEFGKYLGLRLAAMFATFVAMSVVIFLIIELPPGDYASAALAEMISYGAEVSPDLLEALRRTYGLDQPMLVRYFSWFTGVLTGDLGVSLSTREPVAATIAARIGPTAVLQFFVFVAMWGVSLPVGIYSAVRQYSVGDYTATVLGFIGLAVPNFLLAILVLWVTYDQFGFVLSGLYSDQYLSEPMSWAKFLDGAAHAWGFVLVLAVGGMARLIRLMRANLLDELNKPYVKTARAKGLPYRTVVLRYPVRIAVIPLVSTVGWLLPQMISADIIVSKVLNVPTMGPVLLDALMKQDMILAGDILLMLGVLTIIGTLISDLLLFWVDPRIRIATRLGASR